MPSGTEHQNRLSWPDWGSKVVLGSLPSVVPQISVTGAWQGGSDGEREELDQVLQFSDSVTWIRGSHSIKTGGSFVYLYYDFNGTSRSAGKITVGSSFTGNAMADFQLGRATSFDLSNDFTPHLRSQNWAGYLQDDWKISRRFTLNLGLRYELFTPYVDTRDRLQQFRPGQQSSVFPNAPAGLIFPGDTGVPRGLVPTDDAVSAPADAGTLYFEGPAGNYSLRRQTQEPLYLAACPSMLADIAILLLYTGLRLGEALLQKPSDAQRPSERTGGCGAEERWTGAVLRS